MKTAQDNAKKIVDFLIEQIRSQEPVWKQVFSGSIRRIGDWETPIPDYVFEDLIYDKTYALFYSDANRCVEDYNAVVTSAVSVLSRHDYCGLIVPRMSAGKEVGANIERMLYSENLDKLPISIIEYDEDLIGSDERLAISLTRPINKVVNTSIPKTKTERKSYWCWWRDSSHHEVLQLLELSKKYEDEDGDIYTKRIYPEFYNMMISGETKKWDGKPRKKLYSQASFKSEKQNYKIPLCQLGLWRSKDCKLTVKGKKLLATGQVYGSNSTEYFNTLAKLILIDGKHLDLIKDVVEFQKTNNAIIPETSEEFFMLLDLFLTNKNSIGTRKPTAVTTGAKKSYVRDEPKLWNKLGLVKMQSNGRYFKPYSGIKFDWDRINEILLASD